MVLILFEVYKLLIDDSAYFRTWKLVSEKYTVEHAVID